MVVDACVYQAIRRIIDVTSLSNKWLRWCEQSLPNQSVYVPSIFQMRDAFSHVITLLGQGIVDQGLLTNADPSRCLDEVQLFSSNNTIKQLGEIEEHVFRSFFDVADYIVESLAEISMASTESAQANTYITLRGALTRYNSEISDLRSEKSNPPETAFIVVERWDVVLQVLTSMYSFENYEQELMSNYLETYALALEIETRFSESDIRKFDGDFYRKKLRTVELMHPPEEYAKFKSNESADSAIISDPSSWQKGIVNEFKAKTDELNKMKEHFGKLLVALPSTALLSQMQTGKTTLTKIISFIASLVITAVTTGVIASFLFVSSTPVVINTQFIFKLFAVFIGVEFVILVLSKLFSLLFKRLAKNTTTP